MRALETIKRAYGEDLAKTLQTSRVLVIGAGGIGCELLKNLVCSGFGLLEVVDLDTIDVSNLNRQFLFRPEHVGRAKAHVASEAVKEFNPDATIVPHHANIKTKDFGIEFFKKFRLVINALDNLSARRHVNRLCLSAQVPLIEAGTTGYLGQSFVIKKGETECFECEPKPAEKAYPICTIRSLPEKPVHCVVWGKELYKLLFGVADESMMYEADIEASAYMKKIKPDDAVLANKNQLRSWAIGLFNAVFGDEIMHKLSMNIYKGGRTTPKALFWQSIEGFSNYIPKSKHSEYSLASQRVPTLSENAHIFVESLISRYEDEAKRARIGAQFDKDIPDDLQFVTSAANLRAYIFGIEMQSPFDVKSIAGNIIPAIATTNAIVAGLEVLEAVKILRGDSVPKACRRVWVSRVPSSSGHLLYPVQLSKPNPKCFVCSRTPMTCFLDTSNLTLGSFFSSCLRAVLNFNTPVLDNMEELFITDEREEEESDEEWKIKQNLMRTPLKECSGGGIRHSSEIVISDFSQDMEITIHVEDFDSTKLGEQYECGFWIPGRSSGVNPIQALTEVSKAESHEQHLDESSSSTLEQASKRVRLE